MNYKELMEQVIAKCEMCKRLQILYLGHIAYKIYKELEGKQ